VSIGVNWAEVWKPVWKAVWTTVAPEPPAPSRQTGAGKAKKRRRQVVEIDGEVFSVSSAEEAQTILDRAKEQAQEIASQAVQRAVAATKRPVGKVLSDAKHTLLVPSIEVGEDLQPYALQIRNDIRELYESTLRTIEVAALLAKRQREEEDDEDVLLLLI
jgi:hypothetical protein